MLNEPMPRRITPWVLRLLAANAVVLLLQETLFTSPAITEFFRFSPTDVLTKPWTVVSYMFLHGGLFHLVFNGIALFIFGPAVESRLGSRAFILYFLYCGIGAAALSLLLSAMMPIAPFIGASGAVLGVALAFAIMHPDAELILFPIPIPIKAKWLVAGYAVLDLLGAMGQPDGIAHIAHLGGMLAGWLWFMLGRFARGEGEQRLPSMRPRSPVPAARTRRTAQAANGPAPDEPTEAADPARLEADEMDRVLEKISATGLQSLTAAERSFLDSMARRRRDQQH